MRTLAKWARRKVAAVASATPKATTAVAARRPLGIGRSRVRALDRRGEVWTKAAWWVYKYSLLYLALLFVAMVVDRQVAR